MLREVLAEFGFEGDTLLRMSLCWWNSKPTAQHGNAEESVWGWIRWRQSSSIRNVSVKAGLAGESRKEMIVLEGQKEVPAP